MITRPKKKRTPPGSKKKEKEELHQHQKPLKIINFKKKCNKLSLLAWAFRSCNNNSCVCTFFLTCIFLYQNQKKRKKEKREKEKKPPG
jgi:hypothetical protein